MLLGCRYSTLVILLRHSPNLNSLTQIIDNMSQHSDEVLSLVQNTVSAWARCDVNDILRYMAPNIDYYVNVDPYVAPFAASTVGVQALKTRLNLLFTTFAVDFYFAKSIKVSIQEPFIARSNISYAYRDKATNVLLDGCFRCIFHIADGFIVGVDEFHDRSYVEAFARLICVLHQSPGDIS